MHSKGMVVGSVCLFVCLFVFLLECKDDRSCTCMHAMQFASVAPRVCTSVLFIKFMYLCVLQVEEGKGQKSGHHIRYFCSCQWQALHTHTKNRIYFDL